MMSGVALSFSCRHQVVEVFLWEDPSRYVPGGRHAFFVVSRCIPLHGDSFCVYGHINSAISAECGGGPGGANHSLLCGGDES